ncbi:hypothetical protein SPBR_04754 [Sporothrix brasiliensis 5110]|uniref:Carrier domain-containing protein n=1 Tax=Sporothrix brasiliensis 5110 TaxID=1398154 RepID=A0A0C2ISK8_9PEZI|nr:uncharacterized protein SPBR_04754 [Sporothrix brasiliensis 5110]KIH87977.1 hypothetical protein SPBR_04754 [Sporothrix brasiliensis 5110]
MAPDFEHTLHEVARDLLFVATPLQEGMLSASLALADQAYTYTHSKQISASACQLDAPAFSRFFDAVRDTVLSCEILRTRFILTDNQNAPWVGIVSPTQVSDLVDWQVSASGIIRLRIHHALYDANSIRALWHLLDENYARHLSDTIAKVEKQRLFLYRPFAKQVYVAQRTAVAFWVNTIQDYDYVPVVVSSDGVTFTQQQHASSSFHFTVGTDILSALQTTCRKANVALKTALQLSWAKVLCERLYSQVDMVFGEVITTTSDNATITGDEAAVMGPTINTIPMRLRLGPNVNIADALSQLQHLGDQARGPNGMASLREVQTAWRSSRSDGINTSAGLFQSLFVFDGDVSVDTSSDEQHILPVATDAQTVPSNTEKEPMYDDYPFISSFRIHDGVLHGALRTKDGEDATHCLGSQLAAALHYLASASIHSVALDPAVSASFPTMVNGHGCSGSHRLGSDVNVDMTGSTDLAESILQLAIKVVGSRIRGKVGYATKLINVGLDSISAIRFSNLLKKNFGVHVSVFDIMKGSSIESIVRKHSAIENHTDDEGQQLPSPLPEKQVIKDEALAKSLAAEILGLQSVDQIQSVLPVLAGQKHTLQHWLHSGKRFFEAPWVYRVSDGTSISVEKAANAWTSLCCAHDILRTTIVAPQNNIVPGLVQVTFNTAMSPAARFTTLRDDKATIKSLVDTP